MSDTDKVWGKTFPLFTKNNVEVHRIEVVKGGYCSKHWHRYKHNLFYVESGQMEITVWDSEADGRKIVARAGMLVHVRPDVPHRFRALQDSVAYEIYWAELGEDIYRLEEGGLVEDTGD